ncbi:hypothetical protein LCL61_21785 [Amycolatopsis coloradensis]|uniref:Uncharacterized protein n=1 Tax=Amycolatopsis coloradensis TaxID=76021 RepID=A0ACD5BFJ8_9PSEU
MNTSDDTRIDLRDPDGGRKHGGHGRLMIVCCVPMLAIAVILVATGVAGSGFVLAAVACAVMMAMMMRAMGHGDGNRG